MFRNLQVSNSQLVAVLIAALDEGNEGLVRALEFCAITGLKLVDLKEFSRANVRRLLKTGDTPSLKVKRVLASSIEARLRLHEYCRESGKRGELFASSRLLVADFSRICRELQIGVSEICIDEAYQQSVEAFCLSTLYSGVLQEEEEHQVVYTNSYTKKSQTVLPELAFAS